MPPEPLDPREVLGLEPEQLPRHVAIIMDGNGRWAQARGLPRLRGHEAGARAVRGIVETCARLSLDCLTLYSFSLENWNRPVEEVNGLMRLYAEYLAKERSEMMANNVRMVQIGRRDNLPKEVVDELDETVEICSKNTGLTLCLALNYGSRHEIVEASRRLAAQVAAGEFAVDDIDERRFGEALYTAGIPDPDLLIRTANEYRISNFLLWQISYTEFYVTDVHWPDFGVDDLYAAIRDYAGRERRFGEVSQPNTGTAGND